MANVLGESSGSNQNAQASGELIVVYLLTAIRAFFVYLSSILLVALVFEVLVSVYFPSAIPAFFGCVEFMD